MTKGIIECNIVIYLNEEGGRNMELEAIYWLIAMVVLIIIEIMTLGLYTIWFAGGALAAFFATMMGFNGWVQMTVFIIVSFVLLLFTRPIVQKKMNKERVLTNADSLVGKTARIIEKVDNIEGTGRAIVNGKEWMARSSDDNMTFEKDEIVAITRISGVKLIIKKAEE